MKPFCLVALLMWMGVSACAQTQHPFPETVRNLQCVTCHTCDVPTRENPCVRACPRIYLVTVDQDPGDGPELLVLNTASEEKDLYEAVRFSHKWHAEMSGMAGGCTVCHHYNPPGGILACRECHESSRLRTSLGRPDLRGAYHRQCVGCHRDWAQEVGCQDCHALRGEDSLLYSQPVGGAYKQDRHPAVITPDRVVSEIDFEGGPVVTFPHTDHVNLFGLKCEDCHSRESCVRCHDKRGTPSPPFLSAGGKHQACESCHAVDEECGLCHGSEAKPPFNHGTRTGWALGRFHQNLACQRCHTQGGNFAGLSATCSSCHGEWTQATFEHRLTGLTLDENHAELPCEVCHPDQQYREPPGCGQCHDAFEYPDRLPGSRVRKPRQ